MVKQIVVVDDERDILDFLTLALELEGYSVKASMDGGCFRQLYQGELPDLILMDVQLSDEDGRVLCRKLKANERTRNLPIILYSAANLGRQIREEGCADDFLAKPFSLDTLISKVEKHLPV